MENNYEAIEDKFQDWLRLLGIDLKEKQLKQFRRYAELLVEWNVSRNLTGITDPTGIYVKHFYDSVALFGLLSKLPPIERLLDLGTGAGLPGIPLKIIFPDLHLTLCDSLRKRTEFLDYVKQELDLQNLLVVHSRAEDLGGDHKHRESYSHVISRAVANMPTLLEWMIPFAKINGLMLAMKGPAAEEEWATTLKASTLLHARLQELYSYDLPLEMGERKVLIILKESGTSKRFPRKPGEANRNPLL